jgi:hypothetical protein
MPQGLIYEEWREKKGKKIGVYRKKIYSLSTTGANNGGVYISCRIGKLQPENLAAISSEKQYNYGAIRLCFDVAV